jgi:hypothetical protein
MLIWWTNQADCEAIDAWAPHSECDGCLHDGFPEYLRDQYRSRYGRNGRGRLWVDKLFGATWPDISVDPWPKTPLGELLGEKARLGQTYAGIVIRDDDAHLFNDMPGVIIDMELNRPELRRLRAKRRRRKS